MNYLMKSKLRRTLDVFEDNKMRREGETQPRPQPQAPTRTMRPFLLTLKELLCLLNV